MPLFGSAKGAAKDAKEIKDAVGDVKASDVKKGAEDAQKALKMKEDIEKQMAKVGVTPERAKELALQGKQWTDTNLDITGDGKFDAEDLKKAKTKAQDAGKHINLDVNKDGKIDQEDFKRMAQDIRDRKTERSDDLVFPLYAALLFCLVQVLTFGLKLQFMWMGIYIGFFVIWFFAWKGVFPDEYTMYLAGLFFFFDGISIVLDVLFIVTGGFLSLIWDACELCVHGWIFYTIKDHGLVVGHRPNERTPLGPPKQGP